MKPGDVVICACCSATAAATWCSLERAWQEGWPLRLTWTHGPHPRHEAATKAPEFCLWCHERRQVLGADAPPLYRPTASSGGEGAGTTPATARGEGAPAPLPTVNETASPARSSPSPLDRYEELAAAFHRETGMLAPGKDQPAAMNGSPSLEERAERWREWCAARAAAAAPKPKPKGQLALW